MTVNKWDHAQNNWQLLSHSSGIMSAVVSQNEGHISPFYLLSAAKRILLLIPPPSASPRHHSRWVCFLFGISELGKYAWSDFSASLFTLKLWTPQLHLHWSNSALCLFCGGKQSNRFNANMVALNVKSIVKARKACQSPQQLLFVYLNHPNAPKLMWYWLRIHRGTYN